jgi:hypothetical protein
MASIMYNIISGSSGKQGKGYDFAQKGGLGGKNAGSAGCAEAFEGGQDTPTRSIMYIILRIHSCRKLKK